MIKGVLNKIGVFSVTLLATVFAVFMYSPTNGSFAAGDASDVTVNIGTVLSFALSTDSVSMEGMPGETVISDPVRITAYTNNPRGLRVELSDEDDDTSMRHVNPDVTDKVSAYREELYNAFIDYMDNYVEENGHYPSNEEILAKMAELGYNPDSDDLAIESMVDNEWGFTDSMAEYLKNDGRKYINPVGRRSETGSTIIDTKKANAQYNGEGLYTDARYEEDELVLSYSEFVKIGENNVAYDDIEFVVKIGRHLTAGKYTDTVLFTAYTQDH